MVELALHKAVIAALDAGLTCDVYDAVPQNADYPYVTLDTVTAAQEDRLNTTVTRYFVNLAIWSRVRGQQEVVTIIHDIRAALHRQRLTLDSGRVVSAAVTRQNTVREPDNLTFMGQVTVEYVIEH